MSPLFALGVACLFERFARHGRWLVAVSALLVLWNWAMLYMFLNGHIPRSEGFDPLLPLRKCLWLAARAMGLAD